jgi:hypothetical protein
MKVKDLIGKIGFLDAYIESEGTNQSYYHDYVDVVIHLITEVDGEQFEKDVWSSNGVKFGNQSSWPKLCIGTAIFNEEEGCNNRREISDKIKNYEVINFDFVCVLDNSISSTSFGNKYRQKTCTLTINVKG